MPVTAAALDLATDPHPPLERPTPAPAAGDRWVFAFEAEGGAEVLRQAVIAAVRQGIEVIVYIGPKRYAIPWGEVPAAFAHASRGVLRRGRVVPADAPGPSASASFPRLPPPAPDVPPVPPPAVEPAVPVAAEPATLPEPPRAEPAAVVEPDAPAAEPAPPAAAQGASGAAAAKRRRR